MKKAIKSKNLPKDKLYNVPVSWREYGIVQIPASSKKEAARLAKESYELNGDLPSTDGIVNDSFRVYHKEIEYLK